MSTPSWTPAQLSAIETRGKTLLVSAAAGSGKTATLTERIIRRITDKDQPADLSRMLIVTFTRASASDLKTKISKALSDALAKDPTNHHLASQIMLLGSAKICTIDSFYFDVLKSNFNKLSLPGNLRISDDAEKALLYRSVMDETIEAFYAETDWFEDFVDHFAEIRSTDHIANVFISIYEQLLSYRECVDLLMRYEKQLTDSADLNFFETPYGQTALTEIVATLSYIRNVLRDSEEQMEDDEDVSTSYLPHFRNDRRHVEDALERAKENDYEGARAALLSHVPSGLDRVSKATDFSTRMRETRAAVQKKLTALKQNFFAYSPEEICEHMRTTAAICKQLHAFLSAFDQKLAHEKELRGICDFSDIRRYVLSLIVDENNQPKPLALDLREQFDEIYIDEYQDTDEVQDLIFSTIAKPDNRFLVGDIKQSIYVFRGAAPSIFAGYRRTMPPLGTSEAQACSIFMSNNFRCDENVIKFSNMVSSYLFRNCGESIEYSPEDDLIFSKKKPSDDYVSPKVTVALTGLKSDGNEEPTDEEAETAKDKNEDPEARYIVREIDRLLREEKKADGSPIGFRDIAILFRKKRPMGTLMEMLKQAGIPACCAEERDFFENPDVLLVLSLLSTIDNPRRDVPLAGALCSPFFGFSMEDLVVLRQNADDSLSLYDALESYAKAENDALAVKCREFTVALDYWRSRAEALPVDRLLQKLYRELSILSLQGAQENNLIRLYEYARSFESGNFRGLYSFIRYVDEIIESGTKIAHGDDDSGIDAVHLMSIHHSKGLEFPVCFIYGAAKRFNSDFKKNKIQFDSSIGIGFSLHDQSGLGYYDTPIRQAVINQKSRLGREEEMRILYVAMTRARERLYVTAKVKDPDKMRDSVKAVADFNKAYGIINASCFLEWIFAAMQDAQCAAPECFTVETYAENQIEPVKASVRTIAAPEVTPQAQALDPAICELIRERFAYVYPFEHVSELPAKMSVSKLYPAVLDENDVQSLPEDVELESYLEDQFRLPRAFAQKGSVSAAERGTATHTFLQFCDFGLVTKSGVREELARLTEKRFISPEMADMVDVKQLEAFFESRLFDRIRSAKRVWREQRFNLFLPASEFTENREKAALLADETITVQGVIDLFFEDENGKIVLCDYKTDYLTRKELTDPSLASEKLQKAHSRQLSYYAKAIEAMLEKCPDEVLIYSLPLADSVPVSL